MDVQDAEQPWDTMPPRGEHLLSSEQKRFLGCFDFDDSKLSSFFSSLLGNIELYKTIFLSYGTYLALQWFGLCMGYVFYTSSPF